MMKIRKLFFCLLLCGVMGLFAAVQAETAEPMPLAYYQNEMQNQDPSVPFVRMSPYENPVYQVRFGDTQNTGWHFSFLMEEVNGVPFTMTRFAEVMYDGEGEIVGYGVTEDLSFFSSTRLADGEWLEYGMRYDQPTDIRWVAYEIGGVDDSGNEYRFHCLIELLEEEKPLRTTAEFTGEQTAEAGAPFLKLYAEPAPVYAVKNENDTKNPYWWQYDMVFENAGDSAFIVEKLNEVGFNGENEMYDAWYQGSDVAEWCSAEDCVIEPGERWVIECGMPVQDLTMVGMCLTGTDENGQAMRFTGTYELAHEMKAE